VQDNIHQPQIPYTIRYRRSYKIVHKAPELMACIVKIIKGLILIGGFGIVSRRDIETDPHFAQFRIHAVINIAGRHICGNVGIARIPALQSGIEFIFQPRLEVVLKVGSPDSRLFLK